jgi:hypothetical protein
MSEGTQDEGRYRFDQPGTLVRPGPMGRLIRLLLGLVCIQFTYEWLLVFDFTDLRAQLLWVWVALSAYFAADVVNIGFGVRWGQWPRVALAVTLGTGLALALVVDGHWVSEWLWQPLRWAEIYLFGHLGVSFLLAALLGTPGCEMRAIPDLFARLRGGAAEEHYCPGHIDAIDRFERRLYAKLRG